MPRNGQKPQPGDPIWGYSLIDGESEGKVSDTYSVIIWMDGDDPIHVGYGPDNLGYNPTYEGWVMLRKAASDFWEDTEASGLTIFEAKRTCLTLRRKLSLI